jgi:hypothetical protein
MARTVEEVEKAGHIDLKAEADFDLQLNKAIMASATQLKNLGPSGRLGWLRQALTELSLPTDSLAGAEKAAGEALSLDRRIHMHQVEAARRRQEALLRLAGNQDDGSLDAAVDAYTRESPWLDVAAGQSQPLAVKLARSVRRQIEARVGGALMGAAQTLFDMARRKAAEVVAEVAALPKFPDVWSVSNAAEELSKYRLHRASWGTLVAASQDFRLCHLIADMYRDYLGVSQDQLDGAPSWALTYRNWHAVMADPQWLNVKNPLRLRYAIEHDFGPGLWLPDEITVKPEDKTFAGRLRNLGSAVLSGS